LSATLATLTIALFVTVAVTVAHPPPFLLSPLLLPPSPSLPPATLVPIVDTFVTSRRPLLPTFTSRCRDSLFPAVHHLRCSHQWLAVVFSACPAAYRLNHQAENAFMFSLLDLF